MSTIHLVGGEKGGVGKSVVARTLAQVFVDREWPFAAIDADASHGALLRYYSEYAQGIDLESFASADQIMDRALAADRRVLVDLPAQSSRPVKRWMDAGGVLAFSQEMGVNLVLWHVTDGGFDSVKELERVVDTFGNSLRVVVVKNLGRSADFSQLNDSSALSTVLANGGKVLEFPQLDSSTMYKIDRFGSSFWAAANATDAEWALSPMERRRTQLWLNTATQAIDQVGELL